MWTLVSTADDIRLSNHGLDAVAVDAATHALFGAERGEKPSGEVQPLYKRNQILRDQIRQEMSAFDARGLKGVALPQEEVEADATAGDDGVGDEASQAEAAREVIVLDGNDGGRAPSTEPLVARGPLEDSDANEETAPPEAWWRRRMVYSDSEETSS